MRPIPRTYLHFLVFTAMVIFGIGSSPFAGAITSMSAAISATATVDFPLGLVSPADTIITTLPNHDRSMPSRTADSRWLLRLDASDGFLLRINGEACDISGLTRVGSSFVRYLDLANFVTGTETSQGSVVVTLISTDD